MIAFDSNILIRYITEDDPAQTKASRKAIKSLTIQKPAFISSVVLCEISWVLESDYKILKKDIVHTLEKLLSVVVFKIEHLDECIKALKDFKNGSADFSDYLILRIGQSHGATKCLTFDKKALKTNGFEKP